MAKRTPDDDVVQVENRVNGSHDEENDDEDEVHHQRKKDKKKKKKKRKVRLMDESHQTDADRRVLRRRQRELHNDISFDAPAAAAAAAGTNNDSSEDGEGEETKKVTSGLLSWREKNNELWDDVRYTREAVLDSENMDLISSKAAREVEKIIQVRLGCFCLCVTDILFFGQVHHVQCDGLFLSTYCHCYHYKISPFIMTGPSLRCHHSRPKSRQLGLHPNRWHPPVQLGRPRVPSRSLFQLTPLQLFLPLRTT